MKKSYKRNPISFSLTILAIIDSFLVFRISPDGVDSVTHAMLITAFIKVLTGRSPGATYRGTTSRAPRIHLHCLTHRVTPCGLEFSKCFDL